MEQTVSTMSAADPTATKTKEEMETAMMSELHRINSFHNDWPHTRHLPATRMAAAGFYYKGEGDRVTCAFCRGWLQDWDGNDDPMAEHAKHHTHCKFVLDKEDCGNIPLTSSELAERLNGMDTTEEADPEMFDAFPTAGSLALPRPQQPASLHMEDPDTRKSTFMYWPSHVQKNTDDLAEAGFYYSMIKDKVRCFSCFIELERWELSDIPWGEHARWSPDCLYLLQNKGRFYVDQVQKKEYVVDYINYLRREARRRGCHDTMIDEAMRNGGFPFDSELDMENAVLALADQSDAQIGVEAADNPNDTIDTEDERIIHENHENYAVVTQAVHDLREDVNEVFKAQSKQLNGFATTIANQSQQINDQQQVIANHQLELKAQRERIERLERRLAASDRQ